MHPGGRLADSPQVAPQLPTTGRLAGDRRLGPTAQVQHSRRTNHGGFALIGPGGLRRACRVLEHRSRLIGAGYHEPSEGSSESATGGSHPRRREAGDEDIGHRDPGVDANGGDRQGMHGKAPAQFHG